jgi:hypothetical protein
MTRSLSDEQRGIYERLRAGMKLAGPRRLLRSGCHKTFPWVFDNGTPAHKQSVDALARRGLVAIAETPAGREAWLAKDGRP